MHIPDAFLDLKTSVATGVLAAGAVGWAARDARRTVPPRKVPLMGLTAAFVFAAQMLNFPVAGGTSGHMIGGVLCAALLGPSAAVLILASVLVVQCFVFADGGVLALGANIFNMGVISGVGGYGVYRGVARLLPQGLRGQLAAIAFASWVATVVAAVVCAGELAVSHMIPWSTAFPAMTSVHMLIGIGEGLITGLVFYGIATTRPDLVEARTGLDAAAPGGTGYGSILVYGAIIALGLAIFVSPFASKLPDGLDHVAARFGFAERARVIVKAPLPDYEFPWVPSSMATSIAGAVGTLVVFALAVGLVWALVPGRRGDGGKQSAVQSSAP